MPAPGALVAARGSWEPSTTAGDPRPVHRDVRRDPLDISDMGPDRAALAARAGDPSRCDHPPPSPPRTTHAGSAAPLSPPAAACLRRPRPASPTRGLLSPCSARRARGRCASRSSPASRTAVSRSGCGAEGGTRTHTRVSPQRCLRPPRLPFRHFGPSTRSWQRGQCNGRQAVGQRGPCVAEPH